jgi:hypothetical protein
MDGKALRALPSLDRAHVAPKIRGDLLPGAETVVRGGRRGAGLGCLKFFHHADGAGGNCRITATSYYARPPATHDRVEMPAMSLVEG